MYFVLKYHLVYSIYVEMVKDVHHVYAQVCSIGFHETLLELTDNKPLKKVGKAIYALFLASIETTVKQDPERAVRNHQLIIEAVEKRDPELLRKHMKESLSFWMDYIQR